MMGVEVSVGYVDCCKYLVDMFSGLDLFKDDGRCSLDW